MGSHGASSSASGPGPARYCRNPARSVSACPWDKRPALNTACRSDTSKARFSSSSSSRKP